MSTIGRVFIVLNLALAVGFVFAAGTFLQRHTDYKAQYEAKVDELAQEKANYEGRSAELTNEIQDKDRELRGTTSSLEVTKTENASLTEENQRLQSQLADMSSDLKSLNSRASTMSDAIERSTADSRQALDTAMKATEAREAALNEKETAEASLWEAQTQIADLEEKLANAMASVASLEQTTKEQDVLLAIVNRKAPELLANAQPDLRGVVEQAEGSICTVRVTENPGDAEIRPGYRFAVYKGKTYKGEARVTDVDGKFAFCTFTGAEPGISVTAGDAAATNVGF